MIGQEYLTSNENIAYPFATDAPALLAGELPMDFLIDAMITLPSQPRGRLFLSLIAPPDPVEPYVHFHIRDEYNTTVAVLSVNLSQVTEARSILRMQSDRISVMLLTGNSFYSFLSGLSTCVDFEQRLPFETAATEYLPPRITELRTISYNLGPVTLTGKTALREGYNVNLLQTGQEIQINVASGLGAGRHSNCREAPAAQDVISRINGVAPDADGNFRLITKNCTRAVGLTSIELNNDCAPCCSCEDYEKIYTALRKIYEDRLALLKEKVYEMRTAYNDEVHNFNEVLLPNKRPIAISGSGHIGGMQGADRKYISASVVINNRVCVFDDSDAATGNLLNVHVSLQVTPGLPIIKQTKTIDGVSQDIGDSFTIPVFERNGSCRITIVRGAASEKIASASVTVTVTWIKIVYPDVAMYDPVVTPIIVTKVIDLA